MGRSLDRMNACVLVSQLSYGGAERQTTILLEQLAAHHGIRPLVCCMSPLLEPFGERIRAAGCELIHWERRKSYEWGRVFYLRRLLKKRGIELLHAVHYQAIAYGWLARLGLPEVAFVPSIRSTVYDPSARKRMFYRTALPRCPVVIANSLSGKNWVEQFYGVPGDRIEVVYNGLDPGLLAIAPDRLAVRSRLGIPPHAPLLAFVGKRKSHKGLLTLERIYEAVVQALPETHLILMGTGMTEDWVREAFPGRSQVHGLGPRRDIYDLLAAADCLLLTSFTEGFPNAVLEAMVLRVPPVATKVGECPHMIAHGEDGFLFDVDDHTEGARLALQVLGDPGMRQAMGERARAKSLERYGTDAMVDTTLRIYQRALRDTEGARVARRRTRG